MLIPVRAVGAELVLAVIVLLAVVAQAAVLALQIRGTLAAVGAEVVLKIRGHDAVQMGAAEIRGIFLAAVETQAAIIAELAAGGLDADAALIAEPAVGFAAMDAVLSFAQAPFHTVRETVVALGAMGFPPVTVPAKLAGLADGRIHSAYVAVRAVAEINRCAVLITVMAQITVWAPFFPMRIIDVVLVSDADTIGSAALAILDGVDALFAQILEIRECRNVVSAQALAVA